MAIGVHGARRAPAQRGHSQIALTANTYGHIFLDRKKKLAQAMGDLLAPEATAVAERVN